MSVRARSIGLAVLCLGALALPARADDGKPDFASELKKLDESYEKSEKEFFRPFQEAKTDEERAKALDWKKHPAREFVEKYAQLAARAKGTDAGLEAFGWVVVHGRGYPEATRAIADGLDALATTYLESPSLEKILPNLAYSGPDGEKALRKLVEKSPHKAVQACACMTLATMLQFQNPGECKELLEKVAASETSHAARAKSKLFAMEHLQVGKVAPDFEAKDEKGQTFKLSDYRGKITVVDFWGFW